MYLASKINLPPLRVQIASSPSQQVDPAHGMDRTTTLIHLLQMQWVEILPVFLV